MTPFAIFAFYGVPVIAFAVACTGVAAHERAMRRYARKAASERQGRLHLTA